MQMIKRNRNIMLAIASSFLLVALPAVTMAQGRGRLHRRDMSWKCRVFVNCHDARDGRWDARGPQRDLGVFRNGIFISRTRRNRGIRQFDDESLFRSRRLRHRNRAFDNDDFFRGRSFRNRISNDEMFRARRFHRR